MASATGNRGHLIELGHLHSNRLAGYVGCVGGAGDTGQPGVIRATGTERPAERRSVAIRRPG